MSIWSFTILITIINIHRHLSLQKRKSYCACPSGVVQILSIFLAHPKPGAHHQTWFAPQTWCESPCDKKRTGPGIQDQERNLVRHDPWHTHLATADTRPTHMGHVVRLQVRMPARRPRLYTPTIADGAQSSIINHQSSWTPMAWTPLKRAWLVKGPS